MSNNAYVRCYDRFCRHNSGFRNADWYSEDFVPTCTRDEISLDPDAQCLHRDNDWWDLEDLEGEEVD